MQLGLLSHCQLEFDPLKPIILRGLPTEDESTLFAGNVILTLTKPTKILNVSVTLKSQIITYWPEGIGARGTKVTAEKSLGEQTLEILSSSRNDTNTPVLILPVGTHRFSFAFVIPNSTVDSIEDSFGRVRHVIEAEVQKPGMMMLSSLKITKPIMILRIYMSNSLLTNNSLNNLSKTFEKHEVYGDIELLIEAAAFSCGDLFYIRMIIEPQLKHTRLEHMEIKVVEQRKYSVPEMKAWRNETYSYPMPFAGSIRLAEFGESDITTDQLLPIFDKNQDGIELIHDFAHRLAFQTPTCQQKIRPTTYIEEIQFNHHLEISITMSYVDEHGQRQLMDKIITAPPPTYQNRTSFAGIVQQQEKLYKPKVESRCKDMILFDLPITVYDCRLKEDYGKLPSYFELGVKPSNNNNIKQRQTKKKKKSFMMIPNSSSMMDKPTSPHPYLCECYHDFCKEMEAASEALYLSTETTPAMPLLDRIPSMPPPEYTQ